MRRFIAVLILLLINVSAFAGELPTAKPTDVGISAEKLKEVDDVMAGLLAKKRLAGGVVAIARRGKVVHFKPYGKADIGNDIDMRNDHIFRIYSMTKAIVSAGAMMLVDEGKLGLDDPVAKYIPQFKHLEVYGKDGNTKPKREMTVRDLMRHTSGLTYGFFGQHPVDKIYMKVTPLDRKSTLEKMCDKLGKIPLVYEPGTDWLYSVSIDVLGRVIEVAADTSLDQFLQERIFNPLDMKDTGFHVPEEKINRFVPNYSNSFGLTKIEGTKNSQWASKPKLFGGGGGLLSTARDYLHFLQMIANEGELFGKRLLSKKSVQLMTTNQLPKEAGWVAFGEIERTGVGFGLGFAVRVEKSNWDPSSHLGEFGWGGAASTHYWVSPQDDDLIVVTLEQIMPYSFSTEWALKGVIYDAIEKD